MACEENILDLPLRLSYPADTDLIMITDNLGNTFITRWSILKPVPHFVLIDISVDTPAGTPVVTSAMNGIPVSRIIDINRNGVGFRNIVNSAPAGNDIEYTESGVSDANLILPVDLLATEWLKITYI